MTTTAEVDCRKFPRQVTKPTSWRVGVRPRFGDTNIYVHNELLFDTRENAESYAIYLKLRWHEITDTMVFDSFLPSNTTYPFPSDRYIVTRGTQNERIADRRNQAANTSDR